MSSASRRSPAASLRPVAVATVALLLAGCTGDPAPTTSSTAPAPTSASPTPSPTEAAVTVEGADAALTKAVAAVYAGCTGVEAKASLGTWGKEKVAVVTSGDDVTLAVGPRWKVVGGWWPSLDKGASLGKGPRFVLVMGSDARSTNLKGSRADTLQVVGVDGKGGAGVVGIPRDLYVPLSTGGTSKINAAFAYGGGRAQVRTVESLSGLPIEGYVVTGFSGFRKIVDDAGGLPLTIARSFTFLGLLDVEKGRQKADGNTVLAYARERKSLPDGDFGRSRHQQEIILAAAAAARAQGVGSLARAMTITSRHSETDLGAEEALTFLASFYRADPAEVDHTVVDGAIGTSADGQSIVKVTSSTRKPFQRLADGRL
ncbi:LCP family protein [Phycicoccus sp. MAQZ13P-2]|uniref:LCP family glycopolymer transferase n=1 Tax=Phycicoccus mangrovi TaxID=2840470 RepID=UPI001BFFF35E|nr:LCP family protein [Phycicoccus mangrovi]MBT9254925.1 LCP family protein [Phycicoccus mangrovi]MBT9256078.1 LCP family protein [Phycicoccus mangrovi]MBT9273909.1 LCP family protein [Phycicoccus mangrovi]